MAKRQEKNFKGTSLSQRAAGDSSSGGYSPETCERGQKGLTQFLSRDRQSYCYTCEHLEEGELFEVIEEDTPSTDEQSDEEWHLQSSLPVASMDGSFDPNAEPASGEEYLRLVRYGAWQLPFAVKATEEQLSTSKMTPTIDPIDALSRQLDADTPSVSAHLLPSQEFIESFMKSFLEGCRSISDEEALPTAGTGDDNYPPLGHETDWRTLLYPGKEVTEGSHGDEETEKETSPPSLETSEEGRPCKKPRTSSIEPDDIYQQPPSQRQLLQLLKYHRQWMAASEPRTITSRQYQFIIRILQLLDTRMTPWQASILRDLAMLMIHVRSKTQEVQLVRETEESSKDNSMLFYANGIISAIAKRFGQADLLKK